jgi:endonuclease G, mitochondrial
MQKTLLILNVILFSVVLFGDYVQVTNEATIFSQPDKYSNKLNTVKNGESLNLKDDGKQVAGYYHIEMLSPRINGWIYRSTVRRYKGDIPTLQQSTKDTDPFSDHTYYFSETEKKFAAKHLQFGKPQAVYERVREGYTCCLDARLKIPLWVQYELSPSDLDGPAERKNNFSPDEKIPLPARVTNNDYDGNGYDKGHMAPAEDMSRSQEIMDESFKYSNMAPQLGIGFNRHIWAQLEAAIREWVSQKGKLTIITGPIFEIKNGAVSYKVIGVKNVAVPTHFYKIIVNANNPENIETLAFMLPNIDLSGHGYNEYLISIDEIEKLTGLDFLSTLPAEVQKKIEEKKADNVW